MTTPVPVDWPPTEEVTHVRPSSRPPPAPEVRYRNETNPAVRRRLAGQVVAAYGGQVAGLARSMCPRHVKDAEQAGAIGVLRALERYDPTRGVPFWRFARQWAADEIGKWLNVGVYWRVRSHKGADHAERKDDARAAGAQHDEIVSDVRAEAETSAEDLFATAEGMARLQGFLRGLSEEDARLLLCEKRDRGPDQANKARAHRYGVLVARARAAVLGKDDV